MKALFTFSGMDGSDAFLRAPWMAQVVVCTKCDDRPTKLHYMHT
jgi:hypothetical protein